MVNMETEQQGQLAHTSQLRDIVDSFPDGIVHSFGYGSGVFAQQHKQQPERDSGIPSEEKTSKQNKMDLPMVDLIFVVDDAKDWHDENLKLNSNHYAWLCHTMGSSFCSNLQRNYGAKVFFHAFIPVEGQERLLKYGVVQKNDIIEDLRDWNYLYLAGRLHKPTVTVLEDEEVMESQQEYNLPSALAASLLLQDYNNDNTNSPNSIPLEELYMKIANLSYAGDIRMQVGGEDPEKVRKLVHSPGQLERFHDLYKNPLEKLEKKGLINVNYSTSATTNSSHEQRPVSVEWDSSCQTARQALWEQCLTKRLQHQQEQTNSSFGYSNMELAKSLADIVAPAARSQSLKGIFTAGVMKSIRYAGAKFAKGAFRKIVK